MLLKILQPFFQRGMTSAHCHCFSAIAEHESKMQNVRGLVHVRSYDSETVLIFTRGHKVMKNNLITNLAWTRNFY
jgi:hypothetical protein